jgi:chaperonin cofactor prefoldin
MDNNEEEIEEIDIDYSFDKVGQVIFDMVKQQVIEKLEELKLR